MKSLHGTYTALVTPFKGESVDYAGIERLVEYQVTEGIDGIVAVGTTGESPTLDMEEHLDVIKAIVKAAAGRVPVWAGTGANSTDEAISLTREADKNGADAFLIVAPYYNKPSQEGVFRHYAKIAEITRKPIILYSIPGRCGIGIDTETAVRLFEKYPHICAIKEAGGQVSKVSELRQRLGDNYTILSGDDGLTVPFMSVGAKGIVSVASNLWVKSVKAVTEACLRSDYVTAEKLHRELYPVFTNLFIEPNPVPVKYALKKAGIIDSDSVRLPLCELSEKSRAVLDKVLAADRFFSSRK